MRCWPAKHLSGDGRTSRSVPGTSRGGAAVGPLVLAAMLLTGCSNGPSPLPSLTTGSLFGGSDAKATAAASEPQAPANTPINRAFRVGTVSARAVKCGFTFDAAKVKTNWLASESQIGTGAEDMAKADKVYNISYNGVMKAAASKGEAYCAGDRPKEIKADIATLLSGDFTPKVLKPRAEEDDGSLVKFSSGMTVTNPFD
mgnify:CR=1 FL=1